MLCSSFLRKGFVESVRIVPLPIGYLQGVDEVRASNRLLGTPLTREDDGGISCLDGAFGAYAPSGLPPSLVNIYVDTLWISSACRYGDIVFSGRAAPGLCWM